MKVSKCSSSGKGSPLIYSANDLRMGVAPEGVYRHSQDKGRYLVFSGWDDKNVLLYVNDAGDRVYTTNVQGPDSYYTLTDESICFEIRQKG